MSGLFDRLFGRGGKADAPETRLSEAEATRLAHQAAAASPLAAKLVLRGAWAIEGRLAWHFWTPTRGSGLTIMVDDLSGDVQVQERFGR